jgi:hypothetical protein
MKTPNRLGALSNGAVNASRLSLAIQRDGSDGDGLMSNGGMPKAAAIPPRGSEGSFGGDRQT